MGRRAVTNASKVETERERARNRRSNRNETLDSFIEAIRSEDAGSVRYRLINGAQCVEANTSSPGVIRGRTKESTLARIPWNPHGTLSDWLNQRDSEIFPRVLMLRYAFDRSVVAAYLADEACQHHIRALTSNPSSLAAKALGTNPNVTVVQVDVNSVDSLRIAFEGSSLIFANTIFDPAVFVKTGAAGAEEVEAQHGLNIARAASETLSLKHFIWSTLPDAKTWTNGKYVVPHFQSKIPAERYILSPESGLSGKSTFLRVGLYGSNLKFDPYQPLSSTNKDTRVLLLPCSSDVAFPFVGDEVENVGIFAKAIFQQPEKTLGRVVNGSAEMLSCGQWAAAFQNALNRKGGKFKVVSVSCTLQEFEEMWGNAGSEVGLMFTFFNEYGIHSYRGDAQDPEPLTASDLNIASQLRKTEECFVKIDWE